jgi:site-specific recombinase XerD
MGATAAQPSYCNFPRSTHTSFHGCALLGGFFAALSPRKSSLAVETVDETVDEMHLTRSCANLEGSFTRTPYDLRDNIIASLITRTLQVFIGHRSIANTVVYTAVADKRIRNIWRK